MLREFLRTIGAACLIAGAALYFINDIGEKTGDKVGGSELKEEITQLQTKLQRTEEELANLQQATSAAAKSSTEDAVDEIQQETVNAPVVKTILFIEQGDNSTTVANDLARLGMINDTREFESYLAEKNLAGKIQVGEYDLDTSMTTEMIAALITSSH